MTEQIQQDIAMETGTGILKVYVGGLGDLVTVMQTLGPKIVARLVKGALKKAARPMLDSASNLVPKETGFLASQIGMVLFTSTRVKGSYSAAVTTRGRGLYKGQAYYGVFVEMGHLAGPRLKGVGEWKMVRTRGGRLVRRRARERNLMREWVDAQPFMRPAFDTNVAAMSSALESEIATVFDDNWPDTKTAAVTGPANWMEQAGIAPS